jgi:hypothetical protein
MDAGWVVLLIFLGAAVAVSGCTSPASECRSIFPAEILLTAELPPRLVGYNSPGTVFLLNNGWVFSPGEGPPEITCEQELIEGKPSGIVYCRNIGVERFESGRFISKNVTVVGFRTERSYYLFMERKGATYYEVVDVLC